MNDKAATRLRNLTIRVYLRILKSTLYFFNVIYLHLRIVY